MSRLGDGRTSDLIRRFENLALEKSGGSAAKQLQTATKPVPKRLASNPIDIAQVKRQEETPKASNPTPLTSIAAAQSALSAAIAHAQSPAQSEEKTVDKAAQNDAKPVELSTKSRIRASSDVTRPLAIGYNVAGTEESAGLNSRSRSSTIDSTSAPSYTSQLSPLPMDKVAKVQSGKGLLARLNKRADIDPALQVSPGSWLAFAQRCVDEARLCQESGDLETAYVRYMMACNIVSKKFHKQRDSNPVAKDPAYLKLRKDVSTWIMDELEGLHRELRRRSDAEAASRDSQIMTTEQLDQMESKFSQMYPENPAGVLHVDDALGTPHPTTSQTNRSDSSLSGTQLIAEQQSRFDEIDAQVQQNDASVKDMQVNVAVIGQNRGGRRVAVAMSPTLPSIDEAPKLTSYIDPNSTTCTPQELRDLISQAQTSNSGRLTILLLDVRPQQDFAQGHINHRFIVNIDPLALPAKCTSAEIESSLVLVSEEQQMWFRKRDEFDVVVYVSQSMRIFGDTSSKELAPLNALNSAIYHYEYRKPLQHPPLFLIGGFDAWLREVGSEHCLWSESAQVAQTDAQRQPSPPLQHTNSSATTTHDISGMLAYHAPTSGLSQAPASHVQYPAKAAASAAGTVHDFFQQNNGYAYQQQQHFQQQQQPYQQARHQAVYESATHGYNVHTSMPELQYAQQQHAPYVPSKPSALVHEAQLMHQPKTVFDNPTYGFTGPVYSGRTPSEYPVVEPPQASALPTLASDMQQQQQENLRLMEQRKKRRAPPPVPMPQLPQLPPKPAGYTQQPPPQRPQMQAELQTASPRSSMPGFYNHPVAAGSDPSLNGRMHAGGNLRNSAAYQQQVLLQPDPTMGQHLNAAINMPPAATAQPPQHASQLPDSAGYGATGLKNFGNTCFMNSVIQCLVGTVPLTRYFMRGEWKKDLARDASAQSEVSVEFARLLENMWRGQYASISPIGFRSAVAKCSEQFKGNDQEDAHEFASFLLDSLHESLNHVRPRPPPERELTAEEEKQFEQLSDEQQAQLQWKRFTRRNWSIITSIFQGQIQSRLTCMSCKHTSTTYHTFTELSVPIPSLKHNNGPALVRKSQARQMPVNIYQCLDAYSETEILDGDNKWHCPHCRTKRKAAKRLMISRLPLVLVVHLKRFSTIGHFREKLETNVLVPTQKLYMQNYVIPGHHQSTMYNLYGVANHFGTLSSGHYTASVFNGLRDQWNYFDDTRVSPIPESQVATPAAYLLFFVQTQ